jgi:hypothetical protein
MTIMLLAALASEKALLGSDSHVTTNIPGAANDALIGWVDASGGDLDRTNIGVAQEPGNAPQPRCIEPDGFPIAL